MRLYYVTDSIAANVEFLRLALEQDIIIGELPSHTSHWTQPFDRVVFKSLKSNWNTRSMIIAY
jgi:hypothetical protein